MSSLVCEEIFDEESNPSIEEIKDYAVQIGIDPNDEPQLLPIAAEGLMKALPPPWKPCFDEKSKSFFYYNKMNGKTQWEHPLDNVYKGKVKKARADSQSLSLGEPTDDATYMRDDLPSLEEAPYLPKKLSPRRLIKSPTIDLTTTPKQHESKFVKQKSEDHLLINRKLTLNPISDSPRLFDNTELKIAGGGSMFLKTNTKKIEDEDEKKSVRFYTDTDKSLSSDEDEEAMPNPVLQVTLTQQKTSKSPFALMIEDELLDKPPIPKKKNLKVIKPNPADFIKPDLIRTQNSDSEEELLYGVGKIKRITLEEIDLESDQDDSNSCEKIRKRTKKLEDKMEKKVEELKKKIWLTKNEELTEFQENLEDSQRDELKRIIKNEEEIHEKKLKHEWTKLKNEMDDNNKKIIKDEKEKYENKLKILKLELTTQFNKEEIELKEKFDMKKEELEKYYEEKLVEIEKNLAENMEKNRDELISSHNSILDEMKKKHSLVVKKLKKKLEFEEETTRIDNTIVSDNFIQKYEKLGRERDLIEEKYNCLKQKYLKLKRDVKTTIIKRNKKKEDAKSCTNTTNTTCSDTEHTISRITPPKNSEKPPISSSRTKNYDLDTSVSDRSTDEKPPQPPNKNNGYETSDCSLSQTTNRKKLFSKKLTTTTTNGGGKSIKSLKEKTCPPVENLRKQLQKLEDLEDQFPQNQQTDTTYHLRYPFDTQKLDGNNCSELEFFRHRIHLERDSIKRAKDNLRNQKTAFQQRQKDLKLKHGAMARHTYQQLCQEEKDLSDMEVSLHRTRGLLGEKVIRLRHLEETLKRASVPNEKYDDAGTLSDVSSHSASSGISSTDFIDIQTNKGTTIKNYEEPSEIIYSLENLNSEIKEIWEVLRTQQIQSGSVVIPPFVYPDLGWPFLSSGTSSNAIPAPPSIPTLADRLNNYRQQVALANAQSTVVTQVNQGATTTLVERTRNLKHWLKQTGIENNVDGNKPQADL